VVGAKLNATTCRPGEGSMESKLVAGLKVIEVEPGAPLPPEVPPSAER
jgi:hypothetical protein